MDILRTRWYTSYLLVKCYNIKITIAYSIWERNNIFYPKSSEDLNGNWNTMCNSYISIWVDVTIIISSVSDFKKYFKMMNKWWIRKFYFSYVVFYCITIQDSVKHVGKHENEAKPFQTTYSRTPIFMAQMSRSKFFKGNFQSFCGL